LSEREGGVNKKRKATPGISDAGTVDPRKKNEGMSRGADLAGREGQGPKGKEGALQEKRASPPGFTDC